MPDYSKHLFRRQFRKRMRELSEERRYEASLAAYQTLKDVPRPVLSFYSMKDEIDLTSLNLAWSLTGDLYLPRVGSFLEITRPKSGMTVHRVCNLNHLTDHSHLGGLFEPNPKYHIEQPVANIRTVLVPALGFDSEGRRLGRGAGYYDQFLAFLKEEMTPEQWSKLRIIGVGFREQLSNHPLPVEAHDFQIPELKLL